MGPTTASNPDRLCKTDPSVIFRSDFAVSIQFRDNIDMGIPQPEKPGKPIFCRSGHFVPAEFIYILLTGFTPPHAGPRQRDLHFVTTGKD